MRSVTERLRVGWPCGYCGGPGCRFCKGTGTEVVRGDLACAPLRK